MKHWIVLMCALSLSACSTTPPRIVAAPQVFNDALFAPSAERIDAGDVFAVSDEMRRYVRQEIVPTVRAKGAQRALLDALYAKGQLQLDYDAAITRNAREAFEARAGNCLSLVIMTAAFARELGLQVRFQTLAVDESWDRIGEVYFFIGHVNLAMGNQSAANWSSGGTIEWVTVDFLAGQDARRQRTRIIEESRVRAMYMNNKAAEALVRGRLDDAYAWARGAIGQDRDFLKAYNTLGVIYQRHGALAEAERVLRFALDVEPRNAHVMGNLLLVLRGQGRTNEAEQLALQLNQLQPTAPFALYKQGMQAMRDGDYRKAKRLFEQEINRGVDYHEFYFWLAIAHLNLGETGAARRQLERALEYSTTRDQFAIYSTKLQRLKSSIAP